jgi:hypothetical protein
MPSVFAVIDWMLDPLRRRKRSPWSANWMPWRLTELPRYWIFLHAEFDRTCMRYAAVIQYQSGATLSHAKR